MRYALAAAIVMAGVAVGQELPENTNEINTLAVEQAKAFAKHKGALDLDGLTTLSPEVAEALAQHEDFLSLDGLTALSDEAAKALAKHKGRLSLDGLTTLSDEAAEALAQYKGSLYLKGLVTLSSAALAKKLALLEEQLFLEHLTTLSDAAAEALAQRRGTLSLEGLTTLSPELAKALAKHKGALALDGLNTLSDEAAKALAQHEGLLEMPGLTTLSEEAAKALAQHEDKVWVDGLTTLSGEAATALRSNNKVILPKNFARERTDEREPLIQKTYDIRVLITELQTRSPCNGDVPELCECFCLISNLSGSNINTFTDQKGITDDWSQDGFLLLKPNGKLVAKAEENLHDVMGATIKALKRLPLNRANDEDRRSLHIEACRYPPDEGKQDWGGPVVVYDLKDLDGRVDGMVLIKDFMSFSKQWAEHGGWELICPISSKRAFVIHASPETHKKIQSHLESIRQHLGKVR